MKKLFLVSIVLSLLLCSCGNAQNASTEEKPIYNVGATGKNAEIENETESHADDEAGGIGDDLFIDNFKGVGVFEDTSSNTTGFFNNANSSIVCNDGQGTIYYVNYGVYEDNYIYSHSDGTSKLLVDKICNFINYYGGSLYFLVSDKAPEVYPFSWGGKLYKYELTTGNMELLLDKNVCNLHVREGMLYFQNEIYMEGDHWYGNEWLAMQIDDTQPEEMGRLLPFFYGDYQLALSKEGVCDAQLLLVNGEEEIPVTNEYDYYLRCLTIVEDTLWISSRMEDGIPAIASINLANGEHHFYSATAQAPHGGTMGTDVGFGFVVIDNKLFAVSNSTIFVYDEEQDCFDNFIFDQTCYSNLYTDGESLYGLSFSNDRSQYHTNNIVKLSIDGSQREVISE